MQGKKNKGARGGRKRVVKEKMKDEGSQECKKEVPLGGKNARAQGEKEGRQGAIWKALCETPEKVVES